MSTAAEASAIAPPLRATNWRVLVLALLAIAGGALLISDAGSWHYAQLYLLGAVLGLTLYHASFGFGGSWRRFVVQGDGRGIRAQLLAIAVASAIFLPALAAGDLFGQPVVGAVAPVGVSVLVGAALFGFGMQMGGGCASGTLYTVGGGSTRMVVTLIFFMVGSLIGSAHLPWWLAQPSLPRMSLLDFGGLLPALLVQATLLATVIAVTIVIERRTRPTPDETGAAAPPLPLWRRLLQGPWPLVWGAVLLGLLNGVTLYMSGAPWSVAFGYTLWGAKLASAVGLDVASWQFWTWPYPSRALEGSLATDITSVMNLGIIVGALFAAGLAGRFAPVWQIPWRSLLAAAIGGIVMGYGARLAFGCNIGALFSGIASGSPHGWLWLVSAMGGTYLGVRARPWFGLSNK